MMDFQHKDFSLEKAGIEIINIYLATVFIGLQNVCFPSIQQLANQYQIIGKRNCKHITF